MVEANRKTYQAVFQMLKDLGVENPDIIMGRMPSLKYINPATFEPHVTLAEWKKTGENREKNIINALEIIKTTPNAKIYLKPSVVMNVHL